MATHSSVLAWRIPETGEPGGLSSMGSHRVGLDWSDWSDLVVVVVVVVPLRYWGKCWGNEGREKDVMRELHFPSHLLAESLQQRGLNANTWRALERRGQVRFLWSLMFYLKGLWFWITLYKIYMIFLIINKYLKLITIQKTKMPPVGLS